MSSFPGIRWMMMLTENLWHVRFARYEDCPACHQPSGEPCYDLRFPHKFPWRWTLKPHRERVLINPDPRGRVRAAT
jgi:hypothetical protein